MSTAAMTAVEKRALISARQAAVRNAWKNEQEFVRKGKGTRDWTPEEQKELLETGSVDGYEGHHMKSVSLYPEHAGNPENIQFLSSDEHLYGAHQGSYHNLTNGYYDPETQTMNEFSGSELEPVEAKDLSESYVESEETDNDYVGNVEDGEQEGSGEDYTGELVEPSEAAVESPSEYLGDAEEADAETLDGETAETGYGID